MWGSESFGYIEAGLPDISVSSSCVGAGAHTHSRGTMNITGGFRPCVQDTTGSSAWGAFSVANRVDRGKVVSGTWQNNDFIPRFSFSAASGWTGETSSNGNHSHTITSTLNKSPIYGNNETVQPPSVGLRVKTRFK